MQIENNFVLPLRLYVDEFARICRVCEESIRRDIRSGTLKARGKPYLIPTGELLKFGISPSSVTAAHFRGELTAELSGGDLRTN